jgi:hypothetical protein
MRAGAVDKMPLAGTNDADGVRPADRHAGVFAAVEHGYSHRL